MMHPLLALPISLAIILMVTAFGRRLLVLFRVKTVSPLEASIFGAGLGLGTLAYLVLAAGLLRFLYWQVNLGLIVVMCLVALPEIRRIVREVLASSGEGALTRVNLMNSLMTFAAVALGLLAMIPALAPPSGTEWDALAYHLAVPKLYLTHHSIYNILFTSHSNFPFLTEMLYTVGLSFGSTGVAKLFHFAMYVLAAVTILALGKRHLSPTAGKVGALLFMSSPVIFYEAGIAYADLSTAFYVVAAVYALLNWEETRSTPWLVVCGVMGGFALGTKVLAAVPLFAICLLVLAFSGRDREWGKGIKLGVLTGCVALLVGAVWYIKSYVYTGNPVYPFMYEVFGGRNWSQTAADAYKAEQDGFGMGKGLPELLLLPWNLVVHGYEFTNKQNANLFTLIGPAFLGLIPMTVLAGKLRRPILSVAVVGIVSVAAWFMLVQHSRYLIMAVPLLAVLAGEGVAAANERWRLGRHAANLFTALAVVLCLLPGLLIDQSIYPAATGMVSQDQYLEEAALPVVYAVEKFINYELPKDARIVLFDEVRGYYLDRDYMWGNPNHHEMIPWASIDNGRQMVAWFREHGYTHALVNWRYAGKDDDLHAKLMPDAIGRGMMREIHALGGVSVYEFGDERNGDTSEIELRTSH